MCFYGLKSICSTLRLLGQPDLAVREISTETSQGADVAIKVAHVEDYDAMDRIISEVDKDHPLDLVIANAGIANTDRTITPKTVCQRIGLTGGQPPLQLRRVDAHALYLAMRDMRFDGFPHLKKASPTASEALDGVGHVALIPCAFAGEPHD
jgi:NAD(P)-dependent dehydrogenase (short-subunit alcohol dehydrogenase family)